MKSNVVSHQIFSILLINHVRSTSTGQLSIMAVVKESRGRKCLGLAVFLNEGHLSSLGGSHRALLFNLLG